MGNVRAVPWIAARAHGLQQQWHAIDSLELKNVARGLWRDERLRAMSPDEAAVSWFRPPTEGVDGDRAFFLGISVSKAYPVTDTAASFLDLDLPIGWKCQLVLQESAGVYDGRADLSHLHIQRCVFVVAQQPTEKAAFERVQLRADRFIQEWDARAKEVRPSP